MKSQNVPLLLIVDDEDLIRRVQRTLLVHAGYEVVEAASGADALLRIKDGLEPELVLSDLVMPGICGEVLLTRIRAIRPDQKFLFVTGHADPFNRLPLTRHRELRLLDKPFESETLLDVVAGMLGRPRYRHKAEPGALVSVMY